MTREDRAHELRQLRQSNPQRIIALYRAATGTPELGQLPAGVGFTSMIDAIVEHEVATGDIDGDPPHSVDER
jgi:hypothetical protein